MILFSQITILILILISIARQFNKALLFWSMYAVASVTVTKQIFFGCKNNGIAHNIYVEERNYIRCQPEVECHIHNNRFHFQFRFQFQFSFILFIRVKCENRPNESTLNSQFELKYNAMHSIFNKYVKSKHLRVCHQTMCTVY